MKSGFRSWALVLLVSTTSCKTPEEKLNSEVQKANKAISHAAEDVRDIKADEARKINEATTSSKADTKVDATSAIADAERKLDEKKIDATTNVEQAREAIEPGGSLSQQK